MPGGKRSPDKGHRAELEIVRRHDVLGVRAERVPLSGAVAFRGARDVDVYAFGPDSAPLVAEVKARGDGRGFALLERWMSDADLLFLRRDRADPIVVMPWATWVRLLAR